jgi:hypothetical protein
MQQPEGWHQRMGMGILLSQHLLALEQPQAKMML